MGLDIAFSDHHYDVETLKEFGGIIRAIHSASDDPPTRFWAFMHYVSEHHPGILKVNLKPEVFSEGYRCPARRSFAARYDT